MNKILLDIYIPAADTHIEMKVLPKLTVREVTELLKEYLSRQPEMEYTVTGESGLCDRNTGKLYDRGAFLSELQIGNGAILMLI